MHILFKVFLRHLLLSHLLLLLLLQLVAIIQFVVSLSPLLSSSCHLVHLLVWLLIFTTFK